MSMYLVLCFVAHTLTSIRLIYSGGARTLKLGGIISRRTREPSKGGPGACSPGKILKSGIPEMQFPGFSG